MAKREEDNDECPTQPTSYDEAYPGRFLKAGQLQGKTVTFTIVMVERRTLTGGEKGKERKTIITLRNGDKEIQHVAPKLNGFCFKNMFGPKIADWVGKKVWLYPTNKYMAMNGDDAVRVWGSPDIQKDIEIEYTPPRRRSFKMMLHSARTNAGARNQPAAKPEPVQAPREDPGEAEADAPPPEDEDAYAGRMP